MIDDRSWLSRFLQALASVAPYTLAPTSTVQLAPVLTPTATLATVITPTLLHKLGVVTPDHWVSPIVTTCAQHRIDTPLRIAAFLANVMAETGGFSVLTESLDYSPQGLLKQWPSHFTPVTARALGRTESKPANQPAIAETAYGGRLGNGPTGSGDGWRFRGRGLIQLTGRANYTRFAQRIGLSAEGLVDRLTAIDTAADSAGQFWQSAGCNELADHDDIAAVRLAVNGGTTGLPKVRSIYISARAALAI